jgi:hypothetical protein
MSAAAEALLHYAENYRNGCADDSDREFCRNAARTWAAVIIAGEYFRIA